MKNAAAILRELVAAGLSGDALVAAMERIELAEQEAEALAPRSANAERQARFRARRREAALQGVTGNASNVTVTPPLPSPQTPLPSPETPSQKDPYGVQKGSPKPAAKRDRRVALPEGWQPSDASRAKAQALGWSDEQIDGLAEDMRLWAASEGKPCIDWQARFDRWCREEAKRRKPGKPASLGDETLLDELLKAYPKREQPRGEARQAALEALATARTKAEDAVLLRGVMGYAKVIRSRPKDRQDDQYIPGIRKFLAEEKWVDFQGNAKPEPEGMSEETWRMAVSIFKKNRSMWNVGMGPRPGDVGCKAPTHILAEFGFGPKEPPTAVAV